MSQIDKIYKKLTPEKQKEEISLIRNIRLPDDLLQWVDEYKELGERDDFILKWVYYISQTITLDEVDEQYKLSIWSVKFLIILFVILIDDIADKSKKDKFLDKLIVIPYGHIYSSSYKGNDFEQTYFEFTSRLWRNIESILEEYPHFSKLRSIIWYDVNQVMNAMKFSFLINNNPYLINKVEYFTYLTHNMQYIIDIMIDLTCCLDFEMSELGKIREVAWYAQQMTRIGNWVSTWEREIADKDYTSGVFACAIDSNVITQTDLDYEDEDKIVDKIKQANIEELLLEEWENNYQKIQKLGGNIKSIDIDKILSSLEIVIVAHLSSKGYK